MKYTINSEVNTKYGKGIIQDIEIYNYFKRFNWR